MAIGRASDKIFPEEEPEFQVAPMIDVLLVLMTFFMSITSTEVLKTKSKLDLDLPVAKDSKEKESAQREIVINVAWDAEKKSGTIEFEQKEITIQELTRYVAERCGEQKNFRAVIRAGKEVPYSFVREVMYASANGGVDNITFMVLAKDIPKKYTSKK